MIGRIPAPGIPRWTGAYVAIDAGPFTPGGPFDLTATLHLTHRFYWWARWRRITGRGYLHAAAE